MKIVARADGVPLFLEELTKAVLESAEESPAAVTSSGKSPDGLSVPATLHASLVARLDRLAPASQEVASDQFADVSDDDLRAIVSGNAANVFGFDLAALAEPVPA